MASKASRSDNVDEVDPDLLEIAESIALLTIKLSSSTNSTEKNKSDKGPKCYECGGYAHIKRECANLFMYQKISKSGFDVSNSDNGTEKSDHIYNTCCNHGSEIKSGK